MMMSHSQSAGEKPGQDSAHKPKRVIASGEKTQKGVKVTLDDSLAKSLATHCSEDEG